ncbi:MAG: hypothetical protein J0J01_29575 [Reyranella sp.]|uniref:hypothetical protein n=1 Tax=Reyranella sp. TaxID=1929291 RepID=UPI001AD2E61C|nr:hypothetical protein [Reyranella sp.]MBN9091086.1 hypothetical protein [Reyranella sp.]
MARFIIWFVALDWIVFGAMHFTGHEQTVLQMPDFIPPAWRSPLVYLSGALEVTTGVLILAGGRLVRIGALLSILLLIGLAPAILAITFTDKAFLASPAFNTAFRFAVLPHALLIGWLSVRIWRSTPPPPSPPA